MIDRKRFMARVAIGLLAAPCLDAQPAGEVVRIGLVAPVDGPGPQDGTRPVDTLRVALRELGWAEGKNLLIEVRFAGLSPQRQRELAAELKALPAALIVAAGTTTIRAARDGAPGVPIVRVNAGDPVGSGLVASLARPGGDLTGTSAAGEELVAKQLELLSTTLPQLKRFGVLMNRANPANGFFFDAMSRRASKLGLQLDRIELSQPGEVGDAIARAAGSALVVLGDPMFGQQRERIADAALRSRVPAIFGGRPYVAAGGLMSYLSADAWHWRSAAGFVDKILKGAMPADIPVEQPTTFELIINLKTARALGITIPPSLLLRADEVIE